jgi:hypothetical protein
MSMLVEEGIDVALRRSFDLLVVDAIEVVEIIELVKIDLKRIDADEFLLVVGVAVTDVSPGRQRRPLFQRQRSRPPHPAAADHRRLFSGADRDLLRQRGVLGPEVEPDAHSGGELFPVTDLVALALTSTGDPRLGTSLRRLLGVMLRRRDRRRRREETETATMRTVPTPRLPQQPEDTSRLDPTGHERITGRQMLPPLRHLERTMLGVPEPVSGVIHIEIQPSRILGTHPQSLAANDTPATSTARESPPRRARITSTERAICSGSR